MFEKRLDSAEPLATFALTNSFAGFLAPWLVVLAGIAAVGRPQTRRRVALWGIAGSALVIATCLLLTKSRSACLATLFGLLLVGAVWRRKAFRLPWRPIAVAVIGLAILTTGVVAVGGLDVEVLSEATKSLGYRGQYWQATLAMIADHPVLGCGPGNFQDSYKAYKLPEASEEIAEPHNFLLEIWATAGTPAMLAFAAAIAAFLARLGNRGFAAKTPPDVPAPTPSEKADDRPLFVYGGAALGLLLAIPVGFLSVAPSLLVLVALVCPLAAGAVFVLSGWVEDGDLPGSIPAVGVVVLLVNLSAAGGIGFASVGGTLWLLLAIALNRPAGADGWTLPRAAGAGVLVAFGGVAYACYASAYGPVLRCQAAVWLAQRHPAMAEQYLLEAAQADPLSSEPWGQLASRTFAEWKERRAEKALGRFKKYAETALQQAPNSSASWQFSGESYYQAYEITRDPGLLYAAAAAFRRAAELYPNSAMNRARLAIALRAAGDEAGYRAERDRALELDEATPHLDKKLDAELRNSLQRSNSRHD
jgi:hypothetical protein